MGRFRAGTAGARGDWRAERETHADKHKPLARHTARSLLAREASAAGRHGARVAAEGLGRHAAAGLLSVLAGALPELAGLATIACSALWARWSWLSVARLAWTPASSQQGDEMGPPHAALNGESLCTACCEPTAQAGVRAQRGAGSVTRVRPGCLLLLLLRLRLLVVLLHLRLVILLGSLSLPLASPRAVPLPASKLVHLERRGSPIYLSIYL